MEADHKETSTDPPTSERNPNSKHNPEQKPEPHPGSSPSEGDKGTTGRSENGEKRNQEQNGGQPSEYKDPRPPGHTAATETPIYLYYISLIMGDEQSTANGNIDDWLCKLNPHRPVCQRRQAAASPL